MIEQEISRPQAEILQSKASINLFLSGMGAGKTHCAGIVTRRMISDFPHVRGFIGANTYDQLNTATLLRIREYWQSTGLTEWSKENPRGVYVSGKEPPPHWKECNRNFDRYNNIISFVNGHLIFTGSLDNAVMHSGKEFAYAVLDETKDSREEDVKEVILTRIRQGGIYRVNNTLQKEGTINEQYNPLYIFTSPAKVQWINEWFSLDDYITEIGEKIYDPKDYFSISVDDKFAVISSTYHNVHNVGMNYIQNILDNNSAERGKALIYGNPFITMGGEFYSSFDRLKHVGSVVYDKYLPVHISFDQNSVPYNSASLWQVRRNEDVWELCLFDEIALVNPRNSTEEVCEEFINRYPNHAGGMFYYGDASGKNRSTMNKDFKHHYEVVAFKLRKYLSNDSNRVLRQNPPVVKRRDFINALLENKFPVRVIMDESCKYTINDMMYCRQDINGGKDKSIVTDKETGEKYQKYGHFGDNFEYLAVKLFENYYL